MKKQYIINHPSQLNSLSVYPVLRTKALGRLVLKGDIENHVFKERWEKELNKHYYSCGCDTGAVGLFFGLIGGSLWSLFNYFQNDWGLGAVIGATFLVMFIAAGIGKCFGLIRAQKKLTQVINEVKSEWKIETPPVEESWDCG